jgi:SPP1 family predicted phage head-tail adaptor
MCERFIRAHAPQRWKAPDAPPDRSRRSGSAGERAVPRGSVWAKVEPVRGQERVLADQSRGVQTYRITARNEGVWRVVTTNDKLVWRGIKMDVKVAPEAAREAMRMIEAEAGITP